MIKKNKTTELLQIEEAGSKVKEGLGSHRDQGCTHNTGNMEREN